MLIPFPSIYKQQMGYNNAIFQFFSPSAKLSKEEEEDGKEDWGGGGTEREKKGKKEQIDIRITLRKEA